MSGRVARQWALKKKAVPIVVSLGLLLALGYADARTKMELDLYLLFYMPVAIMAWCVGRGPGLLAALLGAGVWSWVDLASGHTYSSEFFQYYDWALRGALLLIIAYAVARIKADRDSEKRLNATLAEALGEVRQLTGLLPICAW